MNKWILTVGALGLTAQAYAADDTVPVISASVKSGTYTAVQNIILSAKDDTDKSPVLYYTTDGKVATLASKKYAGESIQAKDSKSGNNIDLKIRTLAVDNAGNWSRSDFAYRIMQDSVKPVVTPSLAAGSYDGEQSITLKVTDNSDKAPTLYYTTDGSVPQEVAAQLYKSGTEILAKDKGQEVDLRIRTLAVDSAGNKASNTFDYQIASADVVAPVASSTPAAGKYALQQSVLFQVSDNQDKAPILYYTLDGSQPTKSSSRYLAGSKLSIAKSTLIRTLAVDAANNSRLQEFKFTIGEEDTQAPVVTPSPAAGTYDKTQSVSLAIKDNVDPAPKLYYTTDGSRPQAINSQLYTAGGVIAVADKGEGTDMVIRTLAVDASGNQAEDSFSYVINSTPLVVDRLGAIYSPGKTVFSLWSPDSSNVVLNLDGKSYPMKKVADFAGYTDVYQVAVDGDQLLKTYNFSVNGNVVRDPYGKMVKPNTDLDVVMDTSRTDLPSGWVERPLLKQREDAVIYEIHVRDFTMNPNSGVSADKRGKFLGMVEGGTSYNTLKTGIDHLKELGVTHVQLLPVYDFGSCPDVNDTSCYNWGYDPVNFSVPEERYSLTPYDYENRMREFKTMVNEFHKAGIRVIMDVVYNHTYSKSVFGGITGKYYTPTDLSGCSNSIDATNPMVGRMIQDSLEYWLKEYNIDGFRFDLVGIFDYAVVDGWSKYLNNKFADRTLLLYGEPWNGYAPDSRESLRVRLGTVGKLKDAHFGVFNPKFRDAIRGQGDHPGCDSGDCFAFNQNPDTWRIKAGSRGAIRAFNGTEPLSDTWDPMFAADPEQTINYVTAHDNYNLRDKILKWAETTGNSGNNAYLRRIQQFANGIVLTSQGIPFIYGGEEIMRDKDGDKNSFKSPDSINQFDWSMKSSNADIFNYYKDVIALRKAHSGFRLNSWEAINQNVVTTTPAAGVVINDINASSNGDKWQEIVVIMNSGNNYTYNLPSGNWKVAMEKSTPMMAPRSVFGSVVAEGTAVTVLYRE